MTAIGVVAAMPIEASAFCGRPCQHGSVLELGEAMLSCSGIGAERAGQAARALVGRGVAGLVSWGVAGGLDPRLRAGDLLIPTEVRSPSGGAWSCDPGWVAQLRERLGRAVPVRSGPHIATDVVVTTPADKAHLAQTGVLGVDMESAALGAVASTAGLPFLVLRAVCDPADYALPRSARVALDETGRLRIGTFLWSVLRRPADLTRLVRLRGGLRAARRTLSEAARRAGPRLALP